MRSPSPQKMRRRRRYRLNRIKLSVSYDVHDISKLLSIHRNTVRHWLKSGLKAIDDRRPILVHGAELKSFLAEKQQSRRQKCAPGEFYCFKCRVPRKPWGDTADASAHTDKIVKLSALCSVCETEMHKTVRRADLSKLSTVIEIQSMASERISDCPNGIANSDS